MYINQFTRSIFSTSSQYFLQRRFYAEKQSPGNHYNVLGVNSNASIKEIKAAFYKLSKQYHPDVNPDDKNAAMKFNSISNAYDVLNDPIKRREYDYELLLKRPNRDPFMYSNRTGGYARQARGPSDEHYDPTFARYRDSKFENSMNYEYHFQANEQQEKPTETIFSKLILFSLCLTYGLASFFTSSLLYAMHFQQQTEEYPFRRLTFSKSYRKF